MKLNEVMKDSKIKIHATINGHGILLITKADIGVRDGLLVDSLTYFDEDLTFSDPSKVVAVNKRDGRSYEFTAMRIAPVETRYGKFHLIRCVEDGRIINRRMAERYDIDKLGVIRIGDKKDIRNALVYDISMKGIAFILDTDAQAKVGDHIIASFRYDPNYFHFYACEATVVRKFTMNGQPAIGCTLDAMGADLVTLISSKKKEKLGINVDDILGISDSPDSKIASGDKIPVNYVPQLAVSEEYERKKHAHKWELEEKPKNKAPETKEEIEEAQYLSPDEAADLIPERSVEEMIMARANRLTDIHNLRRQTAIEREHDIENLAALDDLEGVDDITKIVSAEDLAELESIEDRTPLKGTGVKSDIPPKMSKTQRNQAYWDELDSIEDRSPIHRASGIERAGGISRLNNEPEPPVPPQNPEKQENASPQKKSRSSALSDPSSPDYIDNRNKKVTLEELEAVTARESRAFKPSLRTREKIDFISSMVSDVAMAASLKKKSGAKRTKQTKEQAPATTKRKIKGTVTPAGARTLRESAERPDREADDAAAAAMAEKVRSSTAPVDPSAHQNKFVDAYQNSMGSKNRVEPPRLSKKRAKAEGFFPEDYDGYFNQNGNSIDEGLFDQKRRDGFLTPEQIADIIELERISKNE